MICMNHKHKMNGRVHKIFFTLLKIYESDPNTKKNMLKTVFPKTDLHNCIVIQGNC